ncbi:MAG: 2-C-methyl-D-erythritol 2,4-cyclodiphosphate synthase [Planctomycetota bacterium]
MEVTRLRIGLGYDIHPLVSGQPLVVGGVLLDSALGAAGHSDGDALFHAVVDACLSAAGLGDIGTLFPDTSEEWLGASGERLAVITRKKLLALDFAPLDIDTVVLLERPVIAPHREAMQQNLARALGVHPDHVRVKGKRGEGLDSVGRGQAISAHAVVLLGPAFA